MRKIIVSLLALFGGGLISSATVTVQGWWHYGEVADYYADSTSNARRFGNAFSRVGSGNAGGVINPFGCGGPLGTTGWTSSSCVYWNANNGDAAAMWNPAGYNPPPANYVIELWVLPVWPGTWTGGGSGKPWLFCSGSSGGVYFQLTNDTVSTMAVSAKIVGTDALIGDPAVVTSNRWTHLAIVVDNSGAQTFYVNGVAHGASVGGATTPAGVIYAGGSPGTTPTYAGYLDELRISTFASGAFSTSDLLLRPAGPNITSQPQSITVWDGGAAPFSVVVTFDTVSSYQWQRNSNNISGATGTSVTLPQVFVPDTLTTVRCIATGSSINATSTPATLTVVYPNSSNVAAYRNVVRAEPSLVAYFPVDNCTGATVTNVADASRQHDGLLEGNGNYSGITNRSFGQRAMSFSAGGDVAIQNNPAFEFQNGNGTIEALVYMDQAPSTDPTIFAETADYGGVPYYAFRASANGGSLVFINANNWLSWAMTASLIGQLTHVALVLDNGTNLTAYANGQSLGTKTIDGMGSPPNSPAWIGSSGLNNPEGYFWPGLIDELAIYTNALPANTIATHNSKFISGTNQIPATITSLPGTGSKTLLAGGSATFTVGASGTPVLAYQWTRNNSPIAGKTKASLTLSPTTVGNSGTYGVTVSNPYGTTNSPTFVLTFVAPGDSYATKVMSDNPSAYWRLGEPATTNGATAFDQAGGHDGTYIITAAPGCYSTNGLLPGVSDKAVAFTGYDANAYANARVEVPYSPALNPNGPFSIECFNIPYYDGNDDGGYLVSSQNRPTGVRQGWMLGASANSVNFDFFLCDGSTTYRQVNSATHCYANVLVHQVGVYDGTNAYIYINGVLDGTWTPSVFVPNPAAPLEIGCRNLSTSAGYLGFNGLMDEVAFYGYALSENQVSNHWASLFARAIITTQPVGVTNIEGSTITLTAAATGYVNTYQWFKDGSQLGDAQNYDLTQHYPQGVVSPTLVIAQTLPSDSGSYQLVVSNPVRGTNTIPVNVLITNDLTPPLVTSVQALGTPNAPPNPPPGPSPYLVRVSFSKRIDPNAGTYTITGATLDPSSPFKVPQSAGAAAVGGDYRQAVLYTTGLTPGQSYTVNVSGVVDHTANANPLAATNITFRAPLLSKGLAQWDYYYLGSPVSGVSSLTGNEYYPNTPMANGSSSSFDSTPITGGDLNNMGYGTAGDYYGSSLSAWLTPTVSGNYTFFLASDDASELWMNTSSVNSGDPQGAVLIAYEPGCCHGFVEPPQTYTSDPIPLQANTSYFIRALHTEGTGGDFVKVAWRIAGDTNAAANLQPIPGKYLSSYAPGPIAFNPMVYSGGVLTFSWVGTATLVQSTNVAQPLSQWTPIATTSPYQVVPANGGPRMFYRLRQ